jgi:hypothetical protein
MEASPGDAREVVDRLVVEPAAGSVSSH